MEVAVKSNNHTFEGDMLFCQSCGRALADRIHRSEEELREAEATRTKREMVERDEWVRYFEENEGDKVDFARIIANDICRKKGTVTISDVWDEWRRLYGDATRYSKSGTTYWAGAIFKGGEFEKVSEARVPSRYSHNGDLVWKLSRAVMTQREKGGNGGIL